MFFLCKPILLHSVLMMLALSLCRPHFPSARALDSAKRGCWRETARLEEGGGSGSFLSPSWPGSTAPATALPPSSTCGS